MKKNNFYVIGGQYESYCYGGTPTLIGAKRLANKHRPGIYRAEDTELIVSGGRITTPDGCTIRKPKLFAEPIEW